MWKEMERDERKMEDRELEEMEDREREEMKRRERRWKRRSGKEGRGRSEAMEMGREEDGGEEKGGATVTAENKGKVLLGIRKPGLRSKVKTPRPAQNRTLDSPLHSGGGTLQHEDR